MREEEEEAEAEAEEKEFIASGNWRGQASSLSRYESYERVSRSIVCVGLQRLSTPLHTVYRCS